MKRATLCAALLLLPLAVPAPASADIFLGVSGSRPGKAWYFGLGLGSHGAYGPRGAFFGVSCKRPCGHDLSCHCGHGSCCEPAEVTHDHGHRRSGFFGLLVGIRKGHDHGHAEHPHAVLPYADYGMPVPGGEVEYTLPALPPASEPTFAAPEGSEPLPQELAPVPDPVQPAPAESEEGSGSVAPTAPPAQIGWRPVPRDRG